MKKISAFIVMAFLVIWSCTTEKETDPSTESETSGVTEFASGDTLSMTGSLVCAHCYALDPENTGHHHTLPQSGYRENCAGFCSAQGYPVGVLLDTKIADNEVWVIRTVSAIFEDYMTETVRIEGTFVSEGVIEPLSIDLKTGEDEWITIM